MKLHFSLKSYKIHVSGASFSNSVLKTLFKRHIGSPLSGYIMVTIFLPHCTVFMSVTLFRGQLKVIHKEHIRSDFSFHHYQGWSKGASFWSCGLFRGRVVNFDPGQSFTRTLCNFHHFHFYNVLFHHMRISHFKSAILIFRCVSTLTRTTP